MPDEKEKKAIEMELERVIHQNMIYAGYASIIEIIKIMKKAYPVKKIKKCLLERFISSNRYRVQEASSNKEVGIWAGEPYNSKNYLFIREAEEKEKNND